MFWFLFIVRLTVEQRFRNLAARKRSVSTFLRTSPRPKPLSAVRLSAESSLTASRTFQQHFCSRMNSLPQGFLPAAFATVTATCILQISVWQTRYTFLTVSSLMNASVSVTWQVTLPFWPWTLTFMGSQACLNILLHALSINQRIQVWAQCSTFTSVTGPMCAAK